MNVLLSTGYRAVVGTSMAIAFRGEGIPLILPQDEQELAHSGWADQIIPFHPGSLNEITTADQAMREPLQRVAKVLSEKAHLGVEQGESTEPAVYIDGYGGMWHCDIVALAGGRAQLLTPFQCRREELVLNDSQESQ